MLQTNSACWTPLAASSHTIGNLFSGRLAIVTVLWVWGFAIAELPGCCCWYSVTKHKCEKPGGGGGGGTQEGDDTCVCVCAPLCMYVSAYVGQVSSTLASSFYFFSFLPLLHSLLPSLSFFFSFFFPTPFLSLSPLLYISFFLTRSLTASGAFWLARLNVHQDRRML